MACARVRGGKSKSFSSLPPLTKVMQEGDFWFRRRRGWIKIQGSGSTRGTVSFQRWQRMLAVGVLLISGVATTGFSKAWAQETGTRKAKAKVMPKYPELARRMKITGLVKVQATVAPNGAVKEMKVIGGHPVLASAVLEAVQKWRFEAGPQETTEGLEFRFDPIE